ncbi:MAG: hypothetical protein U5P41_11185 [Gammaproteobacteria bacterium]|nr:hypothetical protein [Gammaproteobacteria bacterium]
MVHHRRHPGATPKRNGKVFIVGTPLPPSGATPKRNGAVCTVDARVRHRPCATPKRNGAV